MKNRENDQVSSGRTQKATKNVVFNMGNQILTLILTFVSRTVFIRFLGVEYLGISGLFSDVLNLLSLADLGFNTAMVYSFYQPLRDGDDRKIAGLTSFYRKIYLCVAAAVTAIGVGLIPFLKYIINLDREIPHLTLYYLLSLAGVVVSYLCVYKTSVLSADQKQYKITRVTMIAGIVRTVLQILAVWIWKSYILYLVIACVSVIAGNLISSFIAERDYPFIKEKADLDKEEKKGIFQNIKSVFIYKVSTILITATDNTLISMIIGTVAVGYYSNYLMLQNKITMFYVIIFTSVTASVGNLVASGNKQRMYQIFECEQSLSFIICGVIVPCFIILVNDFINLWLGESFLLTKATVLAVGANMYLSCVLQPLWTYREATGMYRKTKWIMFICAVMNIALSVVLGKTVGIAGIIIATSISKICTYIWYEPKLLFRDFFDKKPGIYYLKLAVNLLLVSAITVVGLGLNDMFIPGNWFWWIVKAAVTGIVSLTVMLLVYRKSDGFKLLVNKVKSILKRTKAA